MRLNLNRRALAALLVTPLLWAPLAPMAGGGTLPPELRSLPALGDGSEISLSDERRLGDQIARAIYRDPDYLDDPVLDGYLDTLWRPLLAAAQQRGDLSPELAERFAWTLVLGRDRSVNAFALPGGYFGVHLGLIATVTSADELASVLAHELSHVSQRHIARLITRQGQQAPWVIASMLLGVLAASAAKNADVAQAAIIGGQAVAVQSQLNFSRDMEREADRVGFSVMTEAGYDGQGFVTMFDKLQQASRLNDDGNFPYLRSHPLSTERLADARSRLHQHERPPATDSARPAAPPARVSDAHHAMMAARARVLSETQIDRLRALAATLDEGPTPKADPATLGQRCAATLAAARLRDDARTWAGVQQLRASVPAQPDAQQALQWLELDILPGLAVPPTEAAALAEHLERLRVAALNGDRREGVLLAARASVAGGPQTRQQATQRLQQWTAQHPRDASAWQALATLLAAQQQPVRAARAEAEARLAQLDKAGAIERFRSAQRLAREHSTDHIEQSILDARVREVERQLREDLRDQTQR